MEKETETKNNKCVYCGYYAGYYTKGPSRFERTKQGYCSLHYDVVDNGYCCEQWKSNRRRFSFRKKVAARALHEILMNISAIRQILQEDREEEKHF